MPASVPVELHEDQVPDLDEAPAAIEGELFVLAAGLGGFGSQIVMDLRARSARTGLAHLPEIVLFVEAEDAVLGHAGDFLPQLFGVVVFAEDGDVELVLGQAVILGDQVPGELDGFGFEIVAEGEIAQHLEEGVVAAGVADVLEVVMLAAGADAFLRGGGARIVALFEPEEDVLELVHAGVGEQQRGVVRGHQRRAAHDAMAAGVKEVEKALTDFVACHGSPLFMGLLQLYMWGGLRPSSYSWRGTASGRNRRPRGEPGRANRGGQGRSS